MAIVKSENAKKEESIGDFEILHMSCWYYLDDFICSRMTDKLEEG